MAIVVKYLLMVSIMSLMMGMGLRTAFGEVINIVRQFRLLLRGLLANFFVVPVLFYLAVQLLPFRPDVVIGLLIMAAVPVAPMAPPFVDKAKGDVLYAVGLMTIVTLLCVPLTPAILLLCLPKSEAGLELSAIQIFQTLLTAQLFPIGLGMTINHFSRKWTEKLLLVVPRIGQVGLLVSIIMIIAVQGKIIIDLGVLPNLAVLLGISLSLVVGHWMMVGETIELKRSLAISTAIRKVGLGLLIVNNNYPGTPAVAVVLVFGILSMVVASIYSKLMAKGTHEKNQNK